MTICIAAIGKDTDGKEIIVFATDHMISNSQIGQFELPICKYRELANNTIAMLAGDPLIFDKITEKCQQNCSYDTIKETINKNMWFLKSELIQKQILDVFKIDYDYIKQVLQGTIDNNYIGGIIDSIAKANLETAILLIGFKEGEAHITEIRENRTSDLKGINFHAIGSGSRQAINTLLFQKHSKNDPLQTVIYNVYKAKRNAEVAVGVGKETDLFILTQTKNYKINEKIMATLQDVYEKELCFGKNHKNLKVALTSLTSV